MDPSRIDPKDLKKWLIAIALLYLVLPRDLVPDYLGRGIGLIDDVALMGILTYFFRNHVQQYMAQNRASHAAEPVSEHDASAASFDPHAVLGIAKGANPDEVHAAYRARMREYHPDKVSHLGEDLQDLAHQRTLEIQRAYRILQS